MGVIERRGQRCILGADHLIGREPSAALRLEDEEHVSWRHATLRWTGVGWELQDLGSRNGTFLNGQRIAPGARALIRVGSELAFGKLEEVWLVTDATPPTTSLVDLATGERHFASDGLIALPASESPELFLSCQASGEWLAETGESAWELAALEVLTVAGRQYRFEPGSAMHETRGGGAEQLSPSTLALEFLVTRNEEYVELTLIHRASRIPLRPRAHTYLLLTLARLRVQDQQDPSIQPSSAGWVYQDRLLKMLQTSPNQLALDIYRARRQFGEAGVVDAAQIVQRRATTHEVRIGVPRLAVRVA